MQCVPINGSELEVGVLGVGEPVVTIHPTTWADAFAPLVAEPALADRYQLITYHRRGYGASPRPDGPFRVEDQAADCRTLLEYLGIERAHVVGHSYGGSIALQLALDAPTVVHSLALLEPGVLGGGRKSEYLASIIGPAFKRYREGSKAAGMALATRRTVGPYYLDVIARAGPPGALARAVRDVDTYFQIELPALRSWDFTEADATRIHQPVLSVLGAESASIVPGFAETHELLLRWLPQAESFVLPEANHLQQMMNPRDLARRLAAFFGRHPMSGPAK